MAADANDPAEDAPGPAANAARQAVLDHLEGIIQAAVQAAVADAIEKLNSWRPVESPGVSASEGDYGVGTVILEKLEQLETRLRQQLQALPTSSAEASTPEAGAGDGEHAEALAARLESFLQDRFQALEQTVVDVHRGLDEQLKALDESLKSVRAFAQATHKGLQALHERHESAEKAAASASKELSWHQAVFGSQLLHDEALRTDRQALIDGVQKNDPAALGLAGHLLLFRSAAAERVPNLLKDLGEAYYRWRPKKGARPDPMEQALAEWLTRQSEALGVRNRVELVLPGSRFNATKHKAAEGGVEVTEVFGWVVLRENGAVLHKASVAVR
jgi:hypothetical protein